MSIAITGRQLFEVVGGTIATWTIPARAPIHDLYATCAPILLCRKTRLSAGCVYSAVRVKL
jgi:hypothetical protein